MLWFVPLNSLSLANRKKKRRGSPEPRPETFPLSTINSKTIHSRSRHHFRCRVATWAGVVVAADGPHPHPDLRAAGQARERHARLGRALLERPIRLHIRIGAVDLALVTAHARHRLPHRI